MKYVIFICLICFLACGKVQISSPVLEVDRENLHDIKISNYFDAFKIVKLETNDDALIGSHIGKIQIYDNKLFIHDLITFTLFIFSDSGKFLHKIHKTGQGPGEYISLLDFQLSDKGLFLLVNTNAGSAVMHYDWNYNYLRTIPCGCFTTSLLVDDETILLFADMDKHQVWQIDTTGQVVNQFFPRNDESIEAANIYIASNTFITYGNDKYFSPRHGNDFYKWNKNHTWDTILTLSFGNKTLKKDINHFPDMDNDFPYVVRHKAFIFKDILFFDFIEETKRSFCFHNLKTKKTETGVPVNDLIPKYSRFFPLHQSDNCLIEVLEAHWVLNDCPELMELDPSLKSTVADDNPVLIIYEIK